MLMNIKRRNPMMNNVCPETDSFFSVLAIIEQSRIAATTSSRGQNSRSVISDFPIMLSAAAR
jgi:hypothetical protein